MINNYVSINIIDVSKNMCLFSKKVTCVVTTGGRKQKNNIIHKRLDRISPLAVPLVLEINRQTIDKSEVDEYFLEELENEILTEVGLN